MCDKNIVRDIEDIVNDKDEILITRPIKMRENNFYDYSKMDMNEQLKLRELVNEVANVSPLNGNIFEKMRNGLCKKYGNSLVKKGKILFMYNKMLDEEIEKTKPYNNNNFSILEFLIVGILLDYFSNSNNSVMNIYYSLVFMIYSIMYFINISRQGYKSNLSLNYDLLSTLVQRAGRSMSGVLPMTMVLPPKSTISETCKWDCFMCPKEPNMPRSYHSNEPAVARANEVEFDAFRQFNSRANTLKHNGHPIDKVEFIILGGTFANHSRDMVTIFIRDLFYAANVYNKRPSIFVIYIWNFLAHLPSFFESIRQYFYNNYMIRPRRSLEEEIYINQNDVRDKDIVHIIGISIETRPDTVDVDLLKYLRSLGVTRIQLGVQHTKKHILKKINRGHYVKESEDAIQLCKDYGFKVDIHVMPDLPDSTPELDKEMLMEVFKTNTKLRADYCKIYPCLDVAFSKLREWKKSGKWKPYSESDNGKEKLLDVLIYATQLIPTDMRVNRIQRDFCEAKENNNFLGFESSTIKSNLSQILTDELKKKNIYCQCIRCREVMGGEIDLENMELMITNFSSGDADEYYISYEKPVEHRNTLYGFVRLRLTKATKNSEFPELKGNTALIRELHVYGQLKPVYRNEYFKNVKGKVPQHYGIGKKLLIEAEKIAKEKGFEKMAIISGVGVRNYYKKLGYTLEGTYMVKYF